MALKKCKECNNEVGSKVKKCPHCGTDQRNWFGKHKILTVILVFFILGAIGSLGDSDDSTSVETSKPSTTNDSSKTENKPKEQVKPKEETKPKAEVPLKVGDVIKTGKFEITVTSIEEKSKVGTEYFAASASEGGTYVAIQWKYKNISDRPIGTFSFPTVNITDKNGVKYDSDINASTYFAMALKLDEKVLSDLNPGITVKSASVFEISSDSFKEGGWDLLIDADKEAIIPIN